MSQFNINSEEKEEVEMLHEYPIDSLPEFITNSSLFIMTMDLCPGETVFPFLKSKMPDTLEVHSLKDFQRLVEADAMFSFVPKTQIQILESMYDFWLHNPDSCQLPLPVKDLSHFGNQVITLFSESNSILPVRCFQGNYVELFDYLLKRDGLQKVDSGRFPDYSLPYYGVVCNHVEIVKRGLEAGVTIAKDCFDQAIKKQNLMMFNLLREHKVKFTAKTIELAAELGLPEMYEYFLKGAIHNNMLKNFVVKTLGNKDNLEFLLQRSGTDLTSINGAELLEECLNEVYNVEIFQMVDAYFTKPEDAISGRTLMKKITEFRPGFRYIPEKVIYKDNYELFIYLQSKGMLMNFTLIDYAIENKTRKLTPGFLKRKYSEQLAATMESK